MNTRRIGRAVGVLVAAGMVALGLTVMTAPSAAATTTFELNLDTWAYVDSATPDTSYVQPSSYDLPVGASTLDDGTIDVDRAYLTFDVPSNLPGEHILSATLTDNESTVTDCATARKTQAWQTDPATSPTWNNQPAELAAVPFLSADDACPGANVTWNALHAVKNAAAADATTITIELRLPAGAETKPDLSRSYNAFAYLNVQANAIPTQPTGLHVDTTACAGKPIPVNANSPDLEATGEDADGNYPFTYGFQYWPAGNPRQRTEIDESGTPGYGTALYLDASTLTDGTTYTWRVRTDDGTDTSPWSASCQFHADFTAPAVAPAVSSTTYPASGGPNDHGGTGIPGTFTLKATGDPDVVGFDYAFDDDQQATYVAANHSGGSATIQFTPSHPGATDLAVHAVDAAGNGSPVTDYQFSVADNTPTVTCTPAPVFIGSTVTCAFSPNATHATGALPVVEYDYTNYQQSYSVPADAHGDATATVLPQQSLSGHYRLGVQAKLSNGNLTAGSQIDLDVDLAYPTIDPQSQTVRLGDTLTFTLHAVLPGSVSFSYDSYFASGTVPVGSDGTATITLTPPSPTDSGYLFVRTTTADGTQSGTQIGNFTVLTNGPTVSSTDYPEYQTSGGIGIPGSFTFTSPIPGVTSFAYTINGGAPTTVPADADGTATTSITPVSNDDVLMVTGTLPDGSTSAAVRYEFYAAPAAPNVTCDTYTPAVGSTFHCTFTPVQPNVTSYSYRIEYGDPVTVPADADGQATVTLTAPDYPGYLPLTVSSIEAGGIQSGQTEVDLYVGAAAATSRRSAVASGRVR